MSDPSERLTSPDPREADVDPVFVSGPLVHQSEAPELRHLPSVQELLHQHEWDQEAATLT